MTATTTTTRATTAADLWLTRKQAAWLVDLSPRQFDDALRPLLPPEATRARKKDLTFNAQAVAAALVRYRVEQLAPDGDPLLGGADAGGGTSEWLEKYREAQTLLKRLELEERQGNLASIAELDGALNRFASNVRRAGEALQRRYGNEASDILNTAIDDAIAGWELERSRRDHSDPTTAATADRGGPGDQARGGAGASTSPAHDAPVRRRGNHSSDRPAQR